MRRRADLKLYNAADLESDEERLFQEPCEPISDEDEFDVPLQPPPPLRRPQMPQRSPSVAYTRRPSTLPIKSRDLLVTIQDASDLRAADSCGASDPFCACEIQGKGNTRFETKMISRTLAPVWNEECVVPGLEQGNMLIFSVLDWGLERRELLGQAALSYSQIGPLGLETELQLTLPEVPWAACGTLRVQVDVLDHDGEPCARKPRATALGRSSVMSTMSNQRLSTTSFSRSSLAHRPSLAQTWGGQWKVARQKPERPMASTWAGPRKTSHQMPEMPA